jgi:DNA-binding response OmpR family regulator
MRILVVEDERSLNRIISELLKKEHYSVDSCFDGEEAESCLLCAEYDAIVLDIMLPIKNGLEILRGLRARNDKTPVILLTAKDSISDRVIGLDAGADDYLVKPFSSEELLARIRVIIRRAAGVTSNVFTVGDLTIDCDARIATRGECAIALSGKEFDILEYMIRNKGKVLTREKISNHIWNYDYEGGSNIVDVYIRYLRKKIDDGREVKLIHTVRGAGYVLRAEE